MASHDYYFSTNWNLRGTAQEVFDVIRQPLEYPRWWPEVYLQVEQVEAGAEDGVGRLVELYTRGRLPYTLRWRARTVEVEKPNRIVIHASGDFIGHGIWTILQDGPNVNIRFEWRVRAEKPLLARLSFLLRSLFSWNHRWAMARGEEGLRRELDRRREDEKSKSAGR